MLISALVGSVFVIIALSLKRGGRAVITGAVIVPQFYVTAPSLGALWGVALLVAWVSEATTDREANGISRRYQVGIGIALGAGLCSLVALLWSPSGNTGIMLASQSILVATLLRDLAAPGGSRDREITRAVSIAGLWIAAAAACTIVFRMNGAVEELYLRSSPARVLIGPEVDGLFSFARNNVLDPVKSGGLFYVNANMNSMFLGAGAFVLFATWRLTRARRLLIFAILAYAAVFFTGSKTGLVLSCATAGVWSVLVMSRRRGLGPLGIPLLIASPVLSLAIFDATRTLLPSFYGMSEASAESRAFLWREAGQLLMDKPLLGLGFGGWQAHVELEWGIQLPPHNWIIASWANGGIALALFNCALAAWALWATGAATVRAITPIARQRMAAVFCAVMWVVVHGFFDNTMVYGEVHTVLLFVAAVAFALDGMVERASEEGSVRGVHPCTAKRNRTYA